MVRLRVVVVRLDGDGGAAEGGGGEAEGGGDEAYPARGGAAVEHLRVEDDARRADVEQLLVVRLARPALGEAARHHLRSTARHRPGLAPGLFLGLALDGCLGKAKVGPGVALRLGCGLPRDMLEATQPLVSVRLRLRLRVRVRVTVGVGVGVGVRVRVRGQGSGSGSRSGLGSGLGLRLGSGSGLGLGLGLGLDASATQLRKCDRLNARCA